ncbi:MAG TPA: glycosyltransferase, partial [Chitinophagaceae bacterium]|nr:glycosyltransferase [Chitinophagaceae bacterium]
MIILYIAIFLFVCYGALMIYYWRGWTSASEFTSTENSFNTTVSVIIPARNEEQNIATLLQALHNQTYPAHLVEVIVVNDHSTDNTAGIARSFPRTIVADASDDAINANKKLAIQQGVNTATGKLIIATDADCLPQPGWIETLVSFYERNNSRFV